MKYLAVVTFLACALFCANAHFDVFDVPDSFATAIPVIDENEDHDYGDYEDLLPFPSDRDLTEYKDCLMNCSAGVLECFKGDSTAGECIEEINECSQECKEYGYSEEEDNESIDDEYEDFGNDYEDEEDYDDELDVDDEHDDDDDDEVDDDDDDDGEEEDEEDDDDDEEVDEDDDDEDEEDDDDDDDVAADEDDDDEDEEDDDDDDDGEEGNEFMGGSDEVPDWLRRRKRAARGRGNWRCKLGCRKKLSVCRMKGGRRGKCFREFGMCMKKCSGGKGPRPFPPRPSPLLPKFRNCSRKCLISLWQCIKDNSTRRECFKNFKGCFIDCKKNCSRNGTFPSLQDCMKNCTKELIDCLSNTPTNFFACLKKQAVCKMKCFQLIKKRAGQQTSRLSSLISKRKQVLQRLKNFKGKRPKIPNVTGGFKKRYPIKKRAGQQTSRLSSLISKRKQVLQRLKNFKGKRPKIPNVTGGFKKRYQKGKQLLNQFG